MIIIDDKGNRYEGLPENPDYIKLSKAINTLYRGICKAIRELDRVVYTLEPDSAPAKAMRDATFELEGALGRILLRGVQPGDAGITN